MAGTLTYPTRERLMRHPRLGVGRLLDEELAAASGLVLHPRLGLGRSVSGETGLELPDRELEIQGTDERRRVRRTTAVPFRWICALDLYFSDPDRPGKKLYFRGTGTLISPRHILTAGHCLYDSIRGSAGRAQRRERVAHVVARPGRNGRQALFGRAGSAAVFVHPRWQASLDSSYDYGVIKLDRSIGAARFGGTGNRPLGYWGDPTYGAGTRLIAIKPGFLAGKLANVSGYPGDKCGSQPPKGSASTAQLQACATADWATTQWLAYDRILSVGSKTMRYRTDTKGGQSGAPVWYKGTRGRYLVAVHNLGSTAGYNQGVRVSPELLRVVRAWLKR